MREKFTQLWDEPCDALCITTNGFVKNNGNLVMGAGCAGEAQTRYPLFPKVAGNAVSKHGNIVLPFKSSELVSNTMFQDDDGERWFFTFPVKHKWFEDADISLIKRSAIQLIDVLNTHFDHFQTVLLPRPGCGNGHLSWDDVKTVIEPILDDRVVVVNNKFEG